MVIFNSKLLNYQRVSVIDRNFGARFRSSGAFELLLQDHETSLDQLQLATCQAMGSN